MVAFNYELYFNKLNNVAIKKGYVVSYQSHISCSRVSHSLKAILIKRESDKDTIYAFSHELGHCFIHNKVKHKILNEILAWIIGFGLCVREGVPIRARFFSLACESLKSYWGGRWKWKN